ncbi:uncharacterized protein LOC115414990 isoform X1 [Sphaeramia orbicularis]|uniref:uncharacterized protein LOC115414990 isoform X1 n=1 Tax=Sphaeramia orbicularis TaxID=375764 RepID=UPI0011804368|nr:uncharacterized protein LOC115414990 isoform X1 [Sphaeramia orbicularis]
MAGFRCIQVFLFVILLLEFTAANGDVLYIYGRDGDGVTLPCTSVRDDQNQCNGTSWTINENITRNATELIRLGKITEYAQDKSDRLNITEDCSLVLNKVKDEDVGLYFCRQYDESGHERGHRSAVYLSVVSLTERQDGDNVTFICSVSTHGQCFSRVTWMYNGGEVEKDHPDLTISKSKPSCSANVTFDRRKYFCSSKVQLFKCRVHHNHEKKNFPFRRSFSEEQPDGDGKNNKNTTVTPTPTAPEMNTSGNSDIWYLLRNIIGSVGLAALLISVVTVNIWTRTKGNKTRTRRTTVHKDEGEADGTVHYENLGEPSVSVRFH